MLHCKGAAICHSFIRYKYRIDRRILIMKQTVRYMKLDPRAVTPTYASPMSAGADLYALLDEPLAIPPQATVLVHTGIAVAVPEGYAGMIFARSGLASKRGLAPANKVGVVDADYRGEVMVALHNHGAVPATVEPFERIAQFVIMPFLQADFLCEEALDETERGEGGFGSTGTH